MSAELTKTYSFGLFFWQFCPLGLYDLFIRNIVIRNLIFISFISSEKYVKNREKKQGAQI